MIKLKKFLKCLCLDGINTLYITILDGPSKEDGATIFNLTFQANLFFREKEEILAKYGDFYVDKCYYGNRVGLEELI